MVIKHDVLSFFAAPAYDWNIRSYLSLNRSEDRRVRWVRHNKKVQILNFKDQEFDEYEIRDSILKLKNLVDINMISMILMPCKYAPYKHNKFLNKLTIFGAIISFKDEDDCFDNSELHNIDFDHEFYSHISRLDFENAEKLHTITTVMNT